MWIDSLGNVEIRTAADANIEVCNSSDSTASAVGRLTFIY
jgi:hypothetical protein